MEIIDKIIYAGVQFTIYIAILASLVGGAIGLFTLSSYLGKKYNQNRDGIFVTLILLTPITIAGIAYLIKIIVMRGY